MYMFDQSLEHLRRELHDFTESEILPAADALDSGSLFPLEIFRKVGQAGYLDAEFSYHNTGAHYQALAGSLIIEELSRGLASVGLAVSPHYQCMELISAAGTDGLKREIIAPARAGQILLSFAISEESGGSDAAGVETLAVRDGNDWVLNGKKCWITNAGAADGYIITAKSPLSERSRSFSLYYIGNDAPGLRIERYGKMHGLNSSPMGAVIMEDCRIPARNLIGTVDKAYPLIKPVLNEGRLDMAAVAVGLSQYALELAARRAGVPGHFGYPLASYQGISFSLAEMYSKLMMARNSLYNVASLMENKVPYTREVAALKLFATESCCEICQAASRIFGADGLNASNPVERLLRDSQMLTVAEGTSEIMKIIVSSGIMAAYGQQ